MPWIMPLLTVLTAAASCSQAAGERPALADDKPEKAEPQEPRKTDPKPEIAPSPWQPPAEVDPVLPPVEGDEPKREGGQ